MNILSLPTTPHLEGSIGGDKLDLFETKKFLSHRLVVQEKVVGYGLALYFSRGGAVIRHEGKQVTYPPYRDGFRKWIQPKEKVMLHTINDKLIIYGVWLDKSYYTNAPDLFAIHDIWDTTKEYWWCSDKVDHFCKIFSISSVPKIWEGCVDKNMVLRFAQSSVKYGKRIRRSIILRYQDEHRVLERAQFEILDNTAPQEEV